MRRSARGFSLTEMAVVLAIVGLLLGGLLLPLGTQIEQRNATDTLRQLEAARDALIGFAIVNGRLPCPATAAAGTGDEAPVLPVGGGACTTNYAGFLPAKAIGFQPTDSSGYALDVWGNRIRYALAATIDTSGTTCTAPTLPHYTTSANLKANGITCKPADLAICSVSPATVSNTTCDANTSVTNVGTVVAIVFSTGKNGATGGTGTNEARNLDGNQLFVSRTPDPSGATGGEFDDILVWLSPGVLYGRMIAAGVLP
ncbi:MAG: type II secretion system protein [Betaproteobacteria bacterium]|nr:type II secretion system protein [Betaproteobacteria bacterium]